MFSGIVRGFLQYSTNTADHNIFFTTGLAEVTVFPIVELVVVATTGASVAYGLDVIDEDADALVLAEATCVLRHDGDELDEDNNSSALVA